MNERIYFLKIELLDIEPAIWRHFFGTCKHYFGPVARCHSDYHGMDRYQNWKGTE